MKVHLPPLEDNEVYRLLRERAKCSSRHVLVDDPHEADLLVVGAQFVDAPQLLLESEIYRTYPDKCAAYFEGDMFVPLLPGVYCSAREGQQSRIGRVFSFAYLTQNGKFANRFVEYRPEAAKRYLFTFQGGSTSMLRKRLYRVPFQRPDVRVEDTSSYRHWLPSPTEDQQERQRAYAETLSESHFVLCPRGAGAGTIRLFEVMKAGVAPVLIADSYLLPPGIDWDRFLLRVRERDIARLPQILEAHVASAAERGRLAREAYLAHYADDVVFDGLVELCAKSLQHRPPTETVFRSQQRKMLKGQQRRNARHQLLKRVALRLLRIFRIKNPYRMNRPDR